MCTVTWLMEAESYAVFFNRDELRTRSRPLPPAIKKQNGVRYIAPVDLDGGGTWIGANEFGVTCGLLNNYACSSPIHGLDVQYARVPTPLRFSLTSKRMRGGEDTTTNQMSRGLLVISLLDRASQSEALAKLDAIRLSDFRPFLLTLFAPNQPVVLCIWDGEALQIQNDQIELPISSSSFDTENVIRNRKQEFLHLQTPKQQIDKTLLAAYHASHSIKGSAYSVCMHRADAATVSFSRIRVTPNQIEFLYTPGAPCTTKENAIVTMSRIRD